MEKKIAIENDVKRHKMLTLRISPLMAERKKCIINKCIIRMEKKPFIIVLERFWIV